MSRPDSQYFNVQHVPAAKLDALLYETEQEGHTLVLLRPYRLGATSAYEYTCIFERAAEPPEPRSPIHGG